MFSPRADSGILLPATPWQYDVSDDIPEFEGFNSPGNYVTQILNFQFQIQATKIIFETLSKENVTLADEISITTCSEFARIIMAVGAVAKNHMESTVSAISLWRMSMNPICENESPSITSKKPSTPKPGSSPMSRMRTPAELEQDERQGLIVDHIFSTLILHIAKHYDGKNISDRTVDDLIISVNKFSLYSLYLTKNEIQIRNVNNIKQNYHQIFALLGRYRSSTMILQFFEKIEPYQKNFNALLVLLEAMKFIQYNAGHRSEVLQACKIIQAVNDNWKVWIAKAKNTDLRNIICELVGFVLIPISSVQSSDLDPSWPSLISTLNENLEPLLKKSKGGPHLFPIVVGVLSHASKAEFSDKYETVLELILQPQKEAASRTLALEYLYRLLYVLFSKFSDGRQEKNQKVRGAIATKMFPIGKKILYTPDLQQINIMTDIIHILSVQDIESTFASIVAPLLKGIGTPLNNPEPLIIGMTSFYKIHGRIYRKLSTKDNTSPLFRELEPNWRSDFRKRSLISFLDSLQNNLTVGDFHFTALGQAISRVFTTTHPQLESFNKLSQTEIPKDKQYLSYLLQAASLCLTCTTPSDFSLDELLSNVCSYTIHKSEVLSVCAIKSLVDLIKYKPHFRFNVIRSFINFMQHITDTQVELVSESFKLLSELLKYWYHSSEGRTSVSSSSSSSSSLPSSGDAKDIDIPLAELTLAELNGISLIGLSSPIETIRSHGQDIMSAAFSIFSKLPVQMSSLLFIDLVKNHSYQVSAEPRVYYLFSDFLQASDITSFDDPNGTFNDLHFLASLVSKISEIYPLTCQSIWKMISHRIQPTSQTLFDSSPMISQGKRLERTIIWAHYLALACPSCYDNEKQSTQRDVLRTLSSFVRHEVALFRSVAELCLGYLSISCTNSVRIEMQTQYLFLTADQKKPKNRIAYLQHSFFLRLLSEIKPLEYFTEEKPGLHSYFEMLIFSLDKIPLSLLPSENPLDIIFWRSNLLWFIRNLFEELAETKKRKISEFVSRDIFSKLFEFVGLCSGFSGKIYDELRSSDKKALLSFRAAFPENIQEVIKNKLEEDSEGLQIDAHNAMSFLCYRVIDDPDEERRIYTWINASFSNGSLRKKQFAKNALVNFLYANSELKQNLFSKLVDECYSSDQISSTWNFLTLVDLYVNGRLPIYEHILINLALYKLGDTNEDVRSAAISFVQSICRREFNLKLQLPANLITSSMCVRCQKDISEQVSTHLANPKFATSVFIEALERFRAIDDISRDRLFRYVEPFVRHLELNDPVTTPAILEIMTVITLKFGDLLQQNVENIWLSLSQKLQNIHAILNFTISKIATKRRKLLIDVFKSIVVHCATVNPDDTIKKLVSELYFVKKSGILHSEEEQLEILEREQTQALSLNEGRAKSWSKDVRFHLQFAPTVWPLSRGNAALFLLSDLPSLKQQIIKELVHEILFFAILSLDSNSKLVVKHAKSTIENICVSYAHKDFKNDPKATIRPLIGNSKDINPWNKTDFNVSSNKASQGIYLLINAVFSALKIESLATRFSSLAIYWAHKSTHSHYICRSLQIFRFLSLPITSRSACYLLSTLHSLQSERSREGHSVFSELLLSMDNLAKNSTPDANQDLALLLWPAIYLLESETPSDVKSASQLVSSIFAKLNWKDSQVRELVLSVPRSWPTKFYGIQPLLLKSMCISGMANTSISLLKDIILLECQEIVDPRPTRYLDNLISLLPWLVEHIIDPLTAEQTITASASFHQLFCFLNQPELAAIFEKYAQGEFPDANSFISDLAVPLKKFITVTHELRAVMLLVELIKFGDAKYKSGTLKILRELLRHTDLKQSPLRKKAFAIFDGLFNVLSKDCWEPLIEVFDATVAISKEIEEIQFLTLPNPTDIARFRDGIQSFVFPSTSIQRSTLLAILEEITQKIPEWELSIKDEKNCRVEDSRSAEEVFPLCSAEMPYAAELKDCDVLHPEKKLRIGANESKIGNKRRQTVAPITPRGKAITFKEAGENPSDSERRESIQDNSDSLDHVFVISLPTAANDNVAVFDNPFLL